MDLSIFTLSNTLYVVKVFIGIIMVHYRLQLKIIPLPLWLFYLNFKPLRFLFLNLNCKVLKIFIYLIFYFHHLENYLTVWRSLQSVKYIRIIICTCFKERALCVIYTLKRHHYYPNYCESESVREKEKERERE